MPIIDEKPEVIIFKVPKGSKVVYNDQLQRGYILRVVHDYFWISLSGNHSVKVDRFGWFSTLKEAKEVWERKLKMYMERAKSDIANARAYHRDYDEALKKGADARYKHECEMERRCLMSRKKVRRCAS